MSASFASQETLSSQAFSTNGDQVTRSLVVGGGKIGEAITALLCGTNDYAVTIADRDDRALGRLKGTWNGKIATQCLDVTDGRAMREAMAGHDVVLNAGPFSLTPVVAEAAKDCGAGYFDLTEDVASTRCVKELSEGADSVFVPQCGLAPGYISIVANDLAKRFDEIHEIRMRVGALPQYPSNALKYNMTWSTEGLINEYCNPCEAIHEGEMREVLPLEGLEEFALDGVTYEAFNTSGGLGTLCESYAGKVRDLNYKTIRYPGHNAIIKLLLNDLGLSSHRDLLKSVLETSVPATPQDVIVIFVTVSGMQNGRLTQESYAKNVYGKELGGQRWSAIQLTTAAGICAMVDLVRSGALPARGLVKQEQANLDLFLENRFGRYYA